MLQFALYWHPAGIPANIKPALRLGIDNAQTDKNIIVYHAGTKKREMIYVQLVAECLA